MRLCVEHGLSVTTTHGDEAPVLSTVVGKGSCSVQPAGVKCGYADVRML